MKYQNPSYLYTPTFGARKQIFSQCDILRWHIFLHSVCVCVCDGMVEVNMGHDPTCSSSYAPHSSLSIHGGTWGRGVVSDEEQEDVYPINVNKRGFFNENELFMIILLFIWLIKRSWGWAWKRSEMSTAQGPMRFTFPLTSVPLFKPSINCQALVPKK